MTARHVEKNGSTKHLALPPGEFVISWSPKTHPTKVSIGLAASGRKYAIDRDGKFFRWFCTTDGASSLCGYDSIVEAQDGADANERARPGLQHPSLEDQLAELRPGFVSKGQAAQKAVDAELLAARPFPTSKGAELVDLDYLEEDPKNPRQVFKGIEELAQQIESTQGLLVAIIARELEVTDGLPRLRIVAGARRYRALKLLRKKGVEWADKALVDIRQMTDAQASLAMMEENERENLLPLEQAQGYANMIAEGATPETVASQLGVSAGTVLGRLKLLKLGAKAKDLLLKGVITTAIATPLGRYPVELQDEALEQMLSEQNREGMGRANLWRRGEYEERHNRGSGAQIKLNVGMAISWLQEHFTRSLKTTPFDQKDATILVDRSLWPNLPPVGGGEVAAPACVSCERNSNNMPQEIAGENVHGKSSAGFCTMPPCCEEKWAAGLKQLRDDAKEKGDVKVLGEAQSRAALKRSPYGGNAGKYAKASEVNHADPKKRTWGELLALANKNLEEGEQIRKVLAITDDGKANLVEKGEVEKVLAAEKVLPKPKKEPKPYDYNEQYRRENEKRELRAGIATDVARRYAEMLTEKGPTLPALRALLEIADNQGDTTLPELELTKCKNGRELDTFIAKKGTVGELFALLYLRVLADAASRSQHGFSDETERSATELKLDLKQREKDAAAAAKKEGVADGDDDL